MVYSRNLFSISGLGVFWFFCCAFFCEAKQPLLAPRDVKGKIEEILRSHACHKQMTDELAGRSLQNFIEELDPLKTYFLKDEVDLYYSPSNAFLSRVVQGIKSGNFAVFEEIYQLFLRAIDRRGKLEEKSAFEALIKKVDSEEFKNLSWAETEKALQDRILRIRSLQFEAAEKLGEDARNKFFQRIQKKRVLREQEFLDPNLEERQRLMLSCVLKAVASSLDAHTNYFTPMEANQFVFQVSQRLFGIGAQLQDDLDGILIKGIIENSPASQNNKLKINDKIIAVDHEPVVGLDLFDTVEMIRGEKGTTVLLTILRESEENGVKKTDTLEIELVRGEIVLEESRWESSLEPFGDGAIATLRLFSFYQDQNSSSAQDLRKALELVKKEHRLRGVVLDLRGNMGGLISQAVSVTGLFINKGIVVSIQDHTGKVQHLRETEGKPVWEGPLIVLVNRGSASAAEIVAQALQDYGRAIVVGDDRTFGKGSFQVPTFDPVNMPKINPQGEYKVTGGRYYTVSGKSPQLEGVLSDIIVPGGLSYADIGEKYTKFPLENDAIQPHFDDDLSDVNQLYRIQLGPLYRYNLQQKLTTYVPYLDKLRNNSSLRLEGNKNYQNFLTEAAKKNFDSDAMNVFMQSDLQRLEAVNILKDLIFLLSQSSL